MPLFDAADLFRSCQFETDDGVKAISTFNENSIHQYSFAQIQRTNEARRRIDGKEEKQDAANNKVNDKENVEITISEDLGDGQNAKLDASLKLLGVDDQKLLLPSDELEDDEIHIIETAIDAPQRGSHALQDYQMQLMLLEQQNKKRLLNARTEWSDQLGATAGELREFKGETNTIVVG